MSTFLRPLQVTYEGYQIMTREDLGKLVSGLQLDGETYTPNMPESWCMDFPIADLRGAFSIHSEELSDIAPMRKLFGESVGETSFFDQILETFEEAAGQTGTALSDETDLGDTITEAVAQQFLDGNIDDLSEFTAIEDAAAESLSRHQGDLSLNGLTELSDAAVRVFAERLEENPFASWGGSKELHARFEELKALSGGRENSDSSEDEEEDGSDHANTITVAVAQEFLDGDIDDLGDFTAIDDDAAESLLEHQGELYLNGLTELSDAAARSLSGYGGHLGLPNLKMIPRCYDGCLLLEAMVRRGGCINLSGLTELDRHEAIRLAKHRGGIELGSFVENFTISIEVARILGTMSSEAEDADGGVAEGLNLRISELPVENARELAGIVGR